ncbi:hypothetical protein TSMEX_005190 [Taenia solium]|eukprot:TsM_000943000 transcript=TsM_000943000 gene=TsM_000943000
MEYHQTIDLLVPEVAATLATASVGILPFKNAMSFQDWLKTAKFNLHLYPHRQRMSFILRALPLYLFSAAIDAGTSHDSDIDQCCKTLAHLVNSQRDQTLTKNLMRVIRNTLGTSKRSGTCLPRLTAQVSLTG